MFLDKNEEDFVNDLIESGMSEEQALNEINNYTQSMAESLFKKFKNIKEA